MARSNRNTRIGINVCLDNVKLIQLERCEKGFKVKASARFELPQQFETLGDDYQDAFCDLLPHALGSNGFAGRQGVATLPSDIVDVRTLTLPGSGEDIQKMLRWEAESYLTYDISEAVVDYVVLGETTAGKERHAEVLVASARKKTVERFVRMTKRAGVAVDAVEVVPTALCRLMGCWRDYDGKVNSGTVEQSRDSDCHLSPAHLSPVYGSTPLAAVDIGRTTTTAIVVAGNELRLSRQILQGGSRLTKLIAHGLEMSLENAEALKHEHGLGIPARLGGNAQVPLQSASGSDPLLGSSPGGAVVISQEKIATVIRDLTRPAVEQLAQEAQKFLRYFAMQAHGDSIKRLMLTGGGALLQGLDVFLAQQLGLEVDVLPGLSRFFGSDPTDGDSPAFAVAAGLALSEYRPADGQGGTG